MVILSLLSAFTSAFLHLNKWKLWSHIVKKKTTFIYSALKNKSGEKKCIHVCFFFFFLQCHMNLHFKANILEALFVRNEKRNKRLCRIWVRLRRTIAIRWKLTHVQGFEWPYTLIVITISSTWTRYLSSIHTQITKTNFEDYNRENKTKQNETNGTKTAENDVANPMENN